MPAQGPVNRSAHIQDETPTGLGIAPRASMEGEEVEDVLCGILKPLFSFGTMFLLDFAGSIHFILLHTIQFDLVILL